jgi:hypothetical protein
MAITQEDLCGEALANLYTETKYLSEEAPFLLSCPKLGRTAKRAIYQQHQTIAIKPNIETLHSVGVTAIQTIRHAKYCAQDGHDLPIFCIQTGETLM